jgi:hypothetical protein
MSRVFVLTFRDYKTEGDSGIEGYDKLDIVATEHGAFTNLRKAVQTMYALNADLVTSYREYLENSHETKLTALTDYFRKHAHQSEDAALAEIRSNETVFTDPLPDTPGVGLMNFKDWLQWSSMSTFGLKVVDVSSWPPNPSVEAIV